MPNDKVIFRAMRLEDQPVIAAMMKALYKSLHAPDDYMTDEKIAATFEQLLIQSDYLKLDIFEVEGKIAGYALLFKFWYNEFGGTVWNIDELFVQPEFQRQGISSIYLSSLSKKTTDRVALSLEVLPQNKGAYDLYKRNGFPPCQVLSPDNNNSYLHPMTKHDDHDSRHHTFCSRTSHSQRDV